jgi:hypothetical protein
VRGTDETPKIARLEPTADGTPRKALIPLGQYTVSDGRFRIWIIVGNPEDNAVVGHLMFTQADAASPELSIDEIEQSNERLRALGYVE